MRIVAALAGLLFEVGLAMSGMLDPARLLDFLDVAGVWDPSLAFVLGGAIAVSACGAALQRRMARPVFAQTFDVPTGSCIDGTLLTGAAVFGAGWGLAGFCPGLATAVFATGAPGAVPFTAAMLAGMWLHKTIIRARQFTATWPAVPDAAG